MGKVSTCGVTIGPDQIESHIAWRNHMREPEAELLLEDRAPFSYVLRRGEQQHAYFITFMTRDGTIKHRRFVLDLDRKKWHYRNKEDSKEIFSINLDKLIPLMMECKPQNCIPH